MKRISILLAAAMALLASCNPEGPTNEDPTYGVRAEGDTYFERAAGKKVNVNFNIQSINGKVDQTNVTFTVKADPTLIPDSLASRAVMLPEEAYSFSSTSLLVFRINKTSLSETVTVEMLDTMEDTTYVLPITIDQISGSTSAKKDEKAAMILVFKKITDIYKGCGSKTDPYLIYNAMDLKDMHSQCTSDSTVYFKMMADVDLGMSSETESEQTWEPLNWNSPYDKKIVFDGNGKTIRNLVSIDWTYASFCGVAYGEVYDVTFENAYIEGEYAIGVVGGYAGTTVGTNDQPAHIHNVKVLESTVNNIGGNKNGVGGIVGRVSAKSVIEACLFDGTIKAVRMYVGGIAGYETGTATIKNCIARGRMQTSSQRCGGIMGGLIKENTIVKNCIATMDIISSSLCIGGIVGHANLDNKESFKSPYNEISGCIAWNDSLAVKMSRIQWSSGAIVGFTAPTNTLSGCVRRYGLELSIEDTEAATAMAFTDQNDANSGSPLTVDCTFNADDLHKAPYNGKVAGESETASDVATRLGWDTTIWDLTGPVPELK